MSAEPDRPASATPTLCDWAGGPAVFAALTERFYNKVDADPLLGPLFAGKGADHAAHVAAFLTEVLGGGRPYSEGGGSHAGMIGHHRGRHLTEAQRSRWMTLLLETADEVGLPSDPEFRSAFVGYLEWGTRLAVINSQPGAAQPKADAAMPRWDWGPPGGPYRG